MKRRTRAQHESIERDLDLISSQARVFGYSYIAEGSKLGGQIISRHFAQTLDISVEKGGMFFNSHGAQTGAMWRDFQYSIERFMSYETASHETEN